MPPKQRQPEQQSITVPFCEQVFTGAELEIVIGRSLSWAHEQGRIRRGLEEYVEQRRLAAKQLMAAPSESVATTAGASSAE